MSQRNRPPRDIRESQRELLEAARRTTDERVRKAGEALEVAMERRQAQTANSQRPKD